MNTFRFFLNVEKKIIAKPAFWISFVVYSILLILFLQDGIDTYNVHLETMKEIQQFETEKAKSYLTEKSWTYYGGNGTRLVFIPAQEYALASKAIYGMGLQAAINTGAKLEIYSPQKLNLQTKKNTYLDFSFVLLYGVSIFAICYGFLSFKDKELIRFLVTILKQSKVFFSLIIVKIAIITLIVLILFAVCLILSVLNNISIISSLTTLFSMLFIPVFFSFFIGVIVNLLTMKYKFLLIAGVIFFNVIIVVWALPKLTIPDSNYSPAKTESDNLKDVMAFERNAKITLDKIKEKKPTKDELYKVVAQVAAQGQRDISRSQDKRENAILNYIRESSDAYYHYSIFTPYTFFSAATERLSSVGPESLAGFYNFAINRKVDFCLFYIENKFILRSKIKAFHSDNPDRIIYKSQTGFHDYYFYGILFNLSIIILEIIISFGLFKRGIFRAPTIKIKPKKISITEGLNHFYTKDESIKEYVICEFENLMTSDNNSLNHIYLPNLQRFLDTYNFNLLGINLRINLEDEDNDQLWLKMLNFAASLNKVILSNNYTSHLFEINIVRLKGLNLKWLDIGDDRYIYHKYPNNKLYWKDDLSVEWVKRAKKKRQIIN